MSKSKNNSVSGISCAVSTCKATKRKFNNRTFFKFPEKFTSLFNEWAVECNLSPRDHMKRLKICEIHFDKSLIGKNRRLKQGAVPQYFLGNDHEDFVQNDFSYLEQLANIATPPAVNNTAQQQKKLQGVFDPAITTLEHSTFDEQIVDIGTNIKDSISQLHLSQETKFKSLKENVVGNTMVQEAYEAIIQLKNQRQRDDCDIFGEGVASKLRMIKDEKKKLEVQRIIDNVIYDALFEKLGTPITTIKSE